MYNPNLHFHFTGIGGSGMSGIAEILLNLGFKVSGSDLKRSSILTRLEQLGASVYLGHSPDNLPASSSLLVYSSAVSEDNVEVVEARMRGIPVIPRAEVLAELMRLKFGTAVAGSHGKTTTTSMLGAILEKGGLDPTVIVGGLTRAQGTGARLGKSDYLVAESDESDRSFLLLKPTIAIVTNIDAEHLAAYGSMAELLESFEKFVAAVPFYGLAVLCADDPHVRDLAARYHGRKVTYGISPDADLTVANVEFNKSVTSYDIIRGDQFLCRVDLPVPGRHIMINSLAAVAVGLEFGVAVEDIQESLNNFSGVRRRLEVVAQSSDITLINDYAHHPSEIKATIRAVREGWQQDLGRLLVVFQPHRFSRTRDCFAEFVDAFAGSDRLILTDIYSAGEKAIEGISSQLLCEAISRPKPDYVSDLADVVPLLQNNLMAGDIVLCMGAGSIGTFAVELAAALGLTSIDFGKAA